MIALCVGVFIMIGICSIPFPQLLGNGKGPLQLGFDGNLSFKLAAILLVLKLFATTGSLWAGAEGGLLTPGMAIGALLAICFASVWNLVFPTVPLGAFALIGAAAFLAASMQLPLTAIALIFEFTHLGQDFLIPLSFSVAGSVAALHAVTHLRGKFDQTFGKSAGSRQSPALGSS